MAKKGSSIGGGGVSARGLGGSELTTGEMSLRQRDRYLRTGGITSWKEEHDKLMKTAIAPTDRTPRPKNRF